jgi:hypothetical protein
MPVSLLCLTSLRVLDRHMSKECFWCTMLVLNVALHDVQVVKGYLKSCDHCAAGGG